ncbi:MAG: cysteine-rich CWC family protein [Acidobacteria bacterium]|nr:cysteine-rich CWC family protein [Acidobacteriota bacterium]
MLRELTQFILPSGRAPSTCEACGEPFQCGASLTGCWCFKIKLDEVTRQRMRTQYCACLCQACLERFAQPTPADNP